MPITAVPHTPASLIPPGFVDQPVIPKPVIQLANDFDTGQISGTTITPGNSSSIGDSPFDVVVGAPTYDNTHAHSGTLSVLCVTGAGRQVEWNASSLGLQTIVFGRTYMFAGANAGVRIIQGDGNVTGNLFRITVNTATNTLGINIAGGASVNSVNTIALSQWVRIEWMFALNGGTATLRARLYNTPESLIADDDITQTAAVTDTAFANVRIGLGSSVTPSFWFDDWGTNNVGWLGPSTAGPVTNVLTVALSQATSAAIQNVTGKPLALAETATLSIIKAITPGAVTLTQPTTATLAKQVGKPLPLTEQATLTIAKQVGKPITLAETATLTVTKRAAKTLGVAETAAVSVLKAVTHSAVTLTQASAVTVAKLVGKPIAMTQATSVSLIARLVHLLTIAVTQAASVAIVKQTGKAVAISQTSAVSLAKRVGKVITPVQATTISLAKQVAKLMAVAQTSALSVTARLVHLLTIALTQASAVSVAKQIGKPITVAQTTAVTVAKQPGKRVLLSEAAAVSVAKRAAKTITAAQTSTVTVARRVAKLVTLVETAAVTVSAVVQSISHAITGVFSSSPRAGVNDSPVDGFYTDNPGGGTSSNPKGGGFDG